MTAARGAAWSPGRGHVWAPEAVVAHVRGVLADLNARTDRRLIVHTHVTLPTTWTAADAPIRPRLAWQAPGGPRAEALGVAAQCPVRAVRWLPDAAENGIPHPDDLAALRAWMQQWPLRTDALLVCGSPVTTPEGPEIPVDLWMPRVWLTQGPESVELQLVVVGEATAETVLAELTDCLTQVSPAQTPVRQTWQPPAIDRTTIATQVAALRAGRAHKVVWSQESALPVRATRSALARTMSTARPDAWRIDVQLADGRNHLFASPELLTQVTAATVETMALAGTGAVAELAAGGARLTDEHGRVRDFLQTQLAALGMDALTLEAGVTSAGPLHHWKTRVTAPRPAGRDALDVIFALHPTPALLGLPRLPALALVEAVEPARQLYGGCVARLAMDHSGHGEAVVVLRGGRQAGEQWHVRAGAGLVPDSDPAQEAREIAAKTAAIAASWGVEGPA